MTDTVNAQVVAEVRPEEIPTRPSLECTVGYVVDRAKLWMVFNSINVTIPMVKKAFRIRIPGEKESAWLAKREELVEALIEEVRDLTIQPHGMISDYGKWFKKALDALDAHDANKPEGV